MRTWKKDGPVAERTSAPWSSGTYSDDVALRQIRLNPEAEPILESVAVSFGGDVDLALSELLIAHESIETFLDEWESSNAQELNSQRDRSVRAFSDGLTVPRKKIKLDNGL